MVNAAQANPRDAFFAQHPLFSTSDPAVAQKLGSRALSPFTLSAVGKQPFTARLSGLKLNTSQMLMLEYGDETEVDSTEELDYYVLVVVMRGRMTIRTQHGETVAASGAYGVISPPTHVRLTFEEGTRELCVKVPKSTLNRHLSTFFGYAAESGPIFDVSSARPPAWAPNLVLAARTLEGMPPSAVREQLATRLEQGLLDSLLLSHRHTFSTEIFETSDHQRALGTVQSIADTFIKHPEIRYSMVQVASSHGMSLRSMQKLFQTEFATSPSKFLLDARLDHAHELLTRHGSSRSSSPSVSAAAYAAGFTQLGRFSQLYRRRFGHSPRESLRM